MEVAVERRRGKGGRRKIVVEMLEEISDNVALNIYIKRETRYGKKGGEGRRTKRGQF